MNAEVATRRRAGADAYASLPTPTDSLEHWRYVDIGFDPDALDVPDTPGTSLEPGPFLGALDGRSGAATLVDGHVVDARSDVDGLSVQSFSEVADDSAALPAALSAGMEPSRDRLAAASLAHATDGVLVHVRSRVDLDAPVVVDIQATTPDAISYPHVAVRLDPQARLPLVVVFRSGPGAQTVVPRLDVSVGDGARLDLVTVQAWTAGTRATAHQRFVLGRDASLRIGEAGLGGDLARVDLHVDLEGDGCSADVNGLSFGDGDQTLDYRIAMRHVGRSTTSNVLLKGAVAGRASSVFTGLVRIEEDAVRTSAFETNRNLVLSPDARAQSVPNLEILCDDVVCGHGSTVGQLEEEHLYYLMSRGLPRARAERILVYGFFDEVIDRLPVDGVAEATRSVVHDRYLAAEVGER